MNRSIIMHFVVWTAAMLGGVWLSACGESPDDEGSCVGIWTVGTVVVAFPQCYNDWTRAECEDWDTDQVNATNWSFSEDSCQERGYTKECDESGYSSYYTGPSRACE
jgi:hypothetical protein